MPFEPSSNLLAYAGRVIPRYPQKRSAVMPLLHAIQQECGYISLEAQEWVAAQVGVTPIKVREVVTFYPYFREHPIGKRHIRVCRTLSCALNGSYKVCEEFRKQFHCELETISPDGRVTIEFAECLASCGSGPVALVDEDLHENLTPEKVRELCDRIKAETPANPA